MEKLGNAGINSFYGTVLRNQCLLVCQFFPDPIIYDVIAYIHTATGEVFTKKSYVAYTSNYLIHVQCLIQISYIQNECVQNHGYIYCTYRTILVRIHPLYSPFT